MINDTILIKKLMRCFPQSFINANIEFIAIRKTNLYFNLGTCETELDIKCKVLEWFSRDAYKTIAYNSDKANDNYHKKVRLCINEFLGTDFSEKDMGIIYGRLGNCVNHSLTVKFVESNYDLTLLEEEA